MSLSPQMYIEFCAGGRQHHAGAGEVIDNASPSPQMYIEFCAGGRQHHAGAGEVIDNVCPSPQMYIEFCAGGAVDSIMQELEKPLSEPQIRPVCRQICEALVFLHQSAVIHRDLKAGNVLLAQDGCVRIGERPAL